MSTLQINNTKYRNFKIAAISSGVALTFGGLAFLQPFSFTNNSYAEEVDKSSSAEMSVTVEPVIEIWTTDTNDDTISAANIALDPDESLATTTVRTHVSTSNTTGYTLTIQSESTDAKMTHENDSITKTIDPITGEGTSTTNWTKNKDLNNMWGYSIGNNDSYLGVPGSSSNTNTINETSGPSNDSSTDITFAAKADTSLPAGTYKDTVIFSAVANPVTDTRSLDDFEYMQDVDADGTAADICENSTEWTSSNNKEYTLKDSRDNISYKIRKLADGHCWMAQNFRMTADTLSANNHSTTLTSTDTNIDGSTANFVMPSNTSWSASSGSASKLLKGAMSADNSKAVIGSGKSAAVSGEQAVARGAYCSWCTATADCSADPGTGQKQPSSICPKGWRLANPNNGSSDNNNEYYKLFNDSTNGYGGNATNFNKAFNTYYSSGIQYYLAGYWHAVSSYVLNAGSSGSWWSSTSYSSDANFAWHLYANINSVSLAEKINRYFGLSVRCML